ncbi:MAG: tetratricopeptide repeat protein, partial [Bacteroidia bacterium]|nr:tetratricopeptide repeat protein [Bacteroidia bacterium]
MKKKFASYLFVLFCFGKIFSQDKEFIDSLKSALKKSTNDSVRCLVLSELSENAADGEWEKYNEELKTIAEKNLERSFSSRRPFYVKRLAIALNNFGYSYSAVGNIDAATEFYSKSLKLSEEIADKDGIGAALNNLGGLYFNKGDINAAIDYYERSRKLSEETGNEPSAVNALQNIAFVLLKQGDNSKALEYFKQGLARLKKIGDKRGVAKSLSYIALAYLEHGDPDCKSAVPAECIRAANIKALGFYLKSLKTHEEAGNKSGAAGALLNIGTIFYTIGDTSCEPVSSEKCKASGIKKAIDCLEKSLKIRKETGDKQGTANCYYTLGRFYIKQGDFSRALSASLKGLELSREIGYPEQLKHISLQLKNIYLHNKQYQKALEMYELSVKMSDSLINTETKKASIKTQLKYEYEKKSAADSVKNAEQQKVKDAQLAAQNASLKQEKFQRYSLVVGLSLVVLGLLFVINRFRVTSKQKKIIEEQKIKVDEAFEKLHEKNKEVMDSIHYAHRIQRALVTSEKYVEKHLNRLRNS